jgi:PAS domain S-box-containing protein
MRIGLKLTAGFLMIASLVGAAGYLAQGTTGEVQRQMEQLSGSAIVKVADATEIAVALYASQLAACNLLADARHRASLPPSSGNPPDRRQRLASCWKAVEESLDRQGQATELAASRAAGRGDAQRAEQESLETLSALQRIQQHVDEHHRLQEEFLSLVEEDTDRAEQFIQARLHEHFENHLLPELTSYRQRAEEEFTHIIRSVERAMVVADQRRGFLIVAAAVSAVLMGVFISRSIGKPLSILQRAAIEVGRGQFDTRVAIHSRDEIGVLAGALNQMAADLQDTTISRSYLDNIIQSMREMLIVADSEMRIRNVNPAACVELGYLQGELAGRPLVELISVETLAEGDPFPEALISGSECLMRTKPNGFIPVHYSAAEMHDEAGLAAGLVCVATNISRQKEAEAMLLASLREKELLLKEVHHRVKNNLQVISSLLQLQAQELRDPETARLFRESQGRVRSMALIHEQLYRSDDLARIDFAAYVEDLVGHLDRGLGRRAATVGFRIEVQRFPLPLDLAIPCGMILNELVSNALEHAFQAGRTGEIRIGFTVEEGAYCLTVADNGRGMSEEPIGEATTSLGLKVVRALVRQLHATLDVAHHGGTRFAIRFTGAKGHPSASEED